ncbi:MAG TPA: hypothetical protein DCE56_31770 [Cyanobacteria bacterium UBA8553]|nr:hypothetical protein [Cyanobacteria bacterium UBA8553]HAJ63018.1 hypothetical protein [Cyanobacteria bacterium UBA8543]
MKTKVFGNTSKVMKKAVGCMVVAGVLLALGRPAYGQASETEMRAFRIPPANGYAQTKNFSYVGDYGYYLVPPSSSPGTGSGATDYKYVRYTGVSGKKVWIYGAWGTTSIPAATASTDACQHAHSSYGVWGKYQFGFLSGWIFLGGGGMSGKRDAQGRCVLSTDNPLKTTDSRFGWGKEFLNFDFSSNTIFKELVIGVLSNTHGWGSCTVPSGFKACHEPSWAIAYTLR